MLELTHFKEDGQEEKIEYPFSLVCSENIPAIFIQTESGEWTMSILIRKTKSPECSYALILMVM